MFLFLQSFHFVFNVNGLSQIQNIIVNVHIQYLTPIQFCIYIQIYQHDQTLLASLIW